MKVNFIENKGEMIKCEFSKRKNSKNIKMKVDNGIIKVSLPYYTPYLFAKKFVNNNIIWIEEKLKLFKKKKDTFFYLGKNFRIVKKCYANIKGFNYILDNDCLIVETTLNNSDSDNELFINWLKIKAEEYIPNRVEELAEKFEFAYNKVSIKNLSSRWGSCSAKKNLSFNLKLMHFSYGVIDYVIVHELCHLKEMNHSKKFWNIVKEIIPNYKEYRLQLNQFIH